MRIDSSGNVGIGITNPTFQLHMSGGTTVASRIQLNRGSDDSAQNLRLGWNAIKTTRLSNALSTTQTNLDFVQVGSDGERTCFAMGTNGSLEVNFGIKFPATQFSSSDANTLDDYEEGTWSPSFTGSGTTYTYGIAYGNYVKIGSLVTAQFYLRVTAYSGTNSNVDISGFPFSSANINAYHQSPGQMWSTTAPSAIGLIGNNTTSANLWKNDTSVTIFTASEIINKYFVGSFTYRASA